MTRFGQWWKRAVRAGHAYAELYDKHRFWGREVRSIFLYSLAIPAMSVLAAGFTGGASLALFAAYPWLYVRVRGRRIGAGDSERDAALYARFCVIAKFAHLAGVVSYLRTRLSGRRARIIEYKAATAVVPDETRPASDASASRVG